MAPPRGSIAASLVALVALAVLGVAAVEARAAEVVVVDGDRALRLDDPLVPSRRASDLPAPPAGRSAPPLAAAAVSRGGGRAVERALLRALRGGRILPARYRRWLRALRGARRLRIRLRRTRRLQLDYVVGTLERAALTGRLTASRMPVMFLQLERNAQYWRRLPFPRAGDRVSFRGSELLFQYFPGRGLQLHPLGTFGRANLMHGACTKGGEPCRPDALARLLDEMAGLAAWRGRSLVAWEYLFHFGGGAPPWISGMAQATGVQALARAAELLGRPDLLRVARLALGAFEARAPLGVRTRGFDGGVHYLQYSFAPRLYIFNAFTQALIGLHDFAELTGDRRARRLFEAAEPELRRELPESDAGWWSRYSYRGRLSTREYHELLRELLQGMCNRRRSAPYCDLAVRYRSYQLRRDG